MTAEPNEIDRAIAEWLEAVPAERRPTHAEVQDLRDRVGLAFDHIGTRLVNEATAFTAGGFRSGFYR